MKPDHTFSVALYLRVSTADQDTDNQLLELKGFCTRQGWQIYKVYLDAESGKKGRRERSGFAKLFEDAAKRRFDVVVFWSLDRFTAKVSVKRLIIFSNSTPMASGLKAIPNHCSTRIMNWLPISFSVSYPTWHSRKP
ncbi:MAG: recombinase family protein [Scytonema hyalinum WJT4-NPBG1]|jgi:predicted site-specific integrase-resolvase|nr:recombinase family protein [Scytonema hyalinum WJT4-NPBG1]